MAEAPAAVHAIDRAELKAAIDRGERMVLIETLAPDHYRLVHLPGAINMPVELVSELAPLLVPDKRARVVTYCAGPTCPAALDAARELTALGYTNVRHYPGGKADWISAHFPVERSR